MGANDIFKSSFLSSFSSVFTVDSFVEVILGMAVAVVFGLLIGWVYTHFFKGVIYNRSFVITLIGVTIITCAVTLAISMNVVVSLGMVGALSIVRFRTAIKNPLDLLYLFWAITTGIIAGAGIYYLAVIVFVVLFVMLTVLTKKNGKRRLFVLMVRFDGDIDTRKDIIAELATSKINYTVKSETTRGDFTELAVEAMVTSKNMNFVETIKSIDGVSAVSIVEYDGEYYD